MRIVHVAPTPFGAGGLLGGGERYPLELARALARQVDCELVTFGREPARIREPGGLTVRTLRARWFLGGHIAHPVAPGLFAALSGADLIHTHHMRSLPSRLAALRRRATSQPLILTDHGLTGGDWVGLLPRLFDRYLMVSAFSARVLRVPPARTMVIYGGADPDRYAPDPAADRSGVLFVGRLTPHKGVDRLIRALPSGSRLTVAGSTGHDANPPECDYPQLLRQLAEGRDVHFLGPVPDDSLPDIFRRASVLVLPSVHRTVYGREMAVSELLGLTLLEAMASGTPVVASRIGGVPEIVQHGETGFLVEPGEVSELHDRLAEVLGDPCLARRLGENARVAVLERFTWSKVAERCLAAYQSLVGRRRP